MTFLNLDETREWLDIVYGDTPGLIHICSTRNWVGKLFEKDEIDSALEYVQLLDQTEVEGIYARACTLRHAPPAGERGGDDLSFYLPGLWADLDIAGPGHKTTQPLPATEDEAMRIVKSAGLPAPSHWIHSGGGLYAWWLLREATEVDDLEFFRELSSNWQKCLEHGAKKLGLHYGAGVGDLSRVLRLPGTVNRKAGDQKPCTGFNPHAWGGQRFTVDQLYTAMVDALPPPPPAPEPLPLRDSDEQRPGDIFNATMQWTDVLPAGWVWVYRRGDKWHLRRPGKDRDTSATISLTTDRLYLFTDAAPPFEQGKNYSKFEAYTLLEHNGNFSAAASELVRRGMGTRANPYTSGVLATVGPAEAVPVAASSGAVEQVQAKSATSIEQWDSTGIPVYEPKVFRYMHRWNPVEISYMWSRLHENTFRYVHADKGWMRWDGKIWSRSEAELAHHSASVLATRVLEHAEQVKRDDPDLGKELVREAKKATTSQGVRGIVQLGRTNPQIAASWQDFDKDRHLVALDNGVFNLDTMQLSPHDHRLMQTRKLNASYDPDAKEGRFTRFMEEVLPDQEVREYLQRICGYALLGEADGRALVQLYGPSGSGKTQFMKALFNVLGDYAKRASDTAFQARNSGYKGPSEDLHSLRGSRFAMMPELDEGFKLNVSLIKALTGGDPLTTRRLYGQEVTWRPEFTVFMITNHLPRVAAGEEAYWNRVKPIKFGQVFVDSMGEALSKNDRNLGERMAAEEPEVILNWVLEGLKQYRERGLDAPQQVTQWRDDYRDEVDTVRQFLNEAPNEGRVEVTPQASIMVRQLHLAYAAWCADNQVPPLGMRKFNERMESAGFEKHKKTPGIMWDGIGLTGFVGQATTPMRRNHWDAWQRE